MHEDRLKTIQDIANIGSVSYEKAQAIFMAVLVRYVHGRVGIARGSYVKKGDFNPTNLVLHFISRDSSRMF